MRRPRPSAASRKEQANAWPASQTRSATRRTAQPDRPGEAVEIPAAALPLLRKILDQIAEGRPVAIVADDAELSTQQAAELLGVSRPFLVGLLERGAIPPSAGSEPTDGSSSTRPLMDYKHRADAERLKAMEALAARLKSWAWAIDVAPVIAVHDA